MVIYVVKNDKGEYMTETRDFIKSLWQAELFYDFECAWAYAPSGCNIVECSLMEKYQLVDHNNQIIKEVIDNIKEWHDEEYQHLDLDNDFDVGYSGALSNLYGVLKQIEGEQKCQKKS